MINILKTRVHTHPCFFVAEPTLQLLLNNMLVKEGFQYPPKPERSNRRTQSRYSTSGNLVNQIVYDYNSANQLISEEVSDQTYIRKDIDYIYDDLGNLVQKNAVLLDYSPDVVDIETWDYEYDCYNHLIDVDRNGQDVANYTFNAIGNRVQKYVNATSETINMLYDRGDCVADYNANEDLQRYYITPFMDENMVLTDASSGTPSMDLFYAQDGLGTVRQIFNANSVLVNNYDYEGFGTETSTTGALYNRYRFTGREYDAETEWNVSVGAMNYSFNGTYYYRARTYDTTIGSFTSRDPIPYANLYPYCSANPINITDPLGLANVSVGKYTNCKACAKKYIQCMLGKVQGAIDRAKIALDAMISYAENFDKNFYHHYLPLRMMYNRLRNHDALELFDKMDEYKKADAELQNYYDVKGFFELSYSYFDINERTRTEAGGFNRFNSDHMKHIKYISKKIGRMQTGISDGSVQEIECGKSTDEDMGSVAGHPIYENQSKIIGMKLNMGYYCMNLEGAAKYKLYGNNREKVNAGTLIHELSHLAADTQDYHDTYIGMNANYRVLLTTKRRRNHGDTYARFILNYYEEEPKCKIDKECCSEMEEPTN